MYLSISALESAQTDYKQYLGDGSPLQTAADVYFLRAKELCSELAKTAGAISPSLRALGGSITVSLHLGTDH